MLPARLRTFFERVYAASERHPVVLPLSCLLYGSLIPFSNDFIVISAGIVRYSFWRVMAPLGIGNIIFNTTLAYASPYAYDVLQKLF